MASLTLVNTTLHLTGAAAEPSLTLHGPASAWPPGGAVVGMWTRGWCFGAVCVATAHHRTIETQQPQWPVVSGRLSLPWSRGHPLSSHLRTHLCRHSLSVAFSVYLHLPSIATLLTHGAATASAMFSCRASPLLSSSTVRLAHSAVIITRHNWNVVVLLGKWECWLSGAVESPTCTTG